MSITIKAPGMRRLMARIKKYWADDPEQMLRAVEDWWHNEGKRVFASQGGRVGSRWKRLNTAWAARKGTKEINVHTGKLRRGLIGRAGSWARISKRKTEIGINYDPAAVNALHKWRSLTGVKPQQMTSLDRDMDKELKRFDRTL
jgi:hypothetical protein